MNQTFELTTELSRKFSEKFDSQKLLSIKLMYAYTVVIGLSFISIAILASFQDIPIKILFIPLSGVFITLIGVLLIYYRRFTFVKYWLSISTIYLFTLSSAILKSHGFSNTLLMYFTANSLVFGLFIAPIALFGAFKPKQLFISFVAILPIWVFFNDIHKYFGVIYTEMPTGSFHYYSNFIALLAFVFLMLGTVLILQKINFKVRIALRNNMNIIEKEKKKIVELNEKLTFQSNLYKILDITSSTQELNVILYEVLLQILSVDRLKLQDKGLIFLKNKDGNLNIAAHHNTDALLNTCKEVKSKECLCGKTLFNKKAMFCNNVNHLHDIQPEGMTPHGHYVEPIMSKDGSVLGIINIYVDPNLKKDHSISKYLSAVSNILASKIELVNSHKNVIAKKNQIQLQKNIIDATYESLMDSIVYAKSLQKSILPTRIELENSFEEFFDIFLPKDQVSGDFYFSKDINDSIYFGLGDCTGHGIPGALLAANSMENINNVMFYNQGMKPNVLLEVIRTFNETRFSRNGNHCHYDSMDAAICEYNKKDKKLYFSGGYIDLLLIREGKVLIRRATRNPVGHYPKKEPFELHTLNIMKNDTVYLFSDGIYDQFGREDVNSKLKKLKRKRFHQWLLEVSHLPLIEQKYLILEKLASWQKDTSQTDDISVFAVKFSD